MQSYHMQITFIGYIWLFLKMLEIKLQFLIRRITWGFFLPPGFIVDYIEFVAICSE